MTNMITNIGENLEMRLFGLRGKKQKQDLSEIKQQTEPMFTRREALVKGAKYGVALGTVGAINKAENVIAGVNQARDVNIKSGVHSPNAAVRPPLSNEQKTRISLIKQFPNVEPNPIGTKIPGIPPGIKLAGNIYEQAWESRDDPKKLATFIPKLDYKNEPASYLIAGYLFENPWRFATWHRYGRLTHDDPMTHFAIMIGQYLNKHVRHQNINHEKIENPGYKAIEMTSNQTINTLINNEINLEHITSRNLKILIWTATWLGNHLNPSTESDKIYEKIESPIRKKYPKLKIRGEYNS